LTNAWIFFAMLLLDVGGRLGASQPAAMTRAVAG
jgi:hypothetical protein